MDSDQYKKILDALTDGVYMMNPDGVITFWNKSAELLSGYKAEEILGRECADNLLRHVDKNGMELCLTGCPMAATIKDGKVREATVYMHHKHGHRMPITVRSSPIRDASGKITGAVEVFNRCSDCPNLVMEMEKLRKEVLVDPLTGIGNRRYADITMNQCGLSMREGNTPFGILFVDIDNFKQINDTFGHAVGDRIITMVAKTLTAMLRPLDAACRWGGDEFVILLLDSDEKGLITVANRLRKLLKKSWIDTEESRLSVTASFGCALSDEDESAQSVLERADRQAYLSKEAGRDCIYFRDKDVTSTMRSEP
ncbi:diguanylate cyclase [Pseudodesulfovibrio cashew]|uniref:Diguanylate cyclase n=1 Tax=Pseudodesulfovibrio cashew TaxID=2678688 RepID=A0A6I6JLJ7_9BACT|nr:sensor domain-containing diguanylate cyclase [Pseudodesulfovibrio cashew]QGY41027.1 diguanylate cyclase [Pseudodesulfovibrio cashew]